MRSLKLGIAFLISVCLVLFGFLGPAKATEFVNVSGSVLAPSGFTLQEARVGFPGASFAVVAADGSYSLNVPKGQQGNLVFVTQIFKSIETRATSISTVSRWASSLIFNQTTTQNFEIPMPHQISLLFRDASNGLVENVNFYDYGFNQEHSPFVDQNGTSWSGTQELIENKPRGGGFKYTTTGASTVYLFETSLFEGFNYGERGGLPGSYVLSGKFPISSDKTLKLCFPIRFDSSMKMPSDCFPTKQDQEQKQILTPTPTPTPRPSTTPTPTPTPRPSTTPTPTPTPRPSTTPTPTPSPSSCPVSSEGTCMGPNGFSFISPKFSSLGRGKVIITWGTLSERAENFRFTVLEKRREFRTYKTVKANSKQMFVERRGLRPGIYDFLVRVKLRSGATEEIKISGRVK